MTSRFLGTLDAMLLSASSRSSDCQHTASLRRCIADAGVPVAIFRKRLHLADDPADFLSSSRYGGSIVLTVPYESVFYHVTFSAGNVASCVAPGCRRFRSRCGHVKLERPLQANHKALVSAAEGRVAASVSKTRDAASEPAPFIVSAKKDEGIEKLPSETARDPADTEERTVARRAWRTLLRCASEIADGAVWARTADWRGLCRDRAAEHGEPASEGIQQMRQPFRTCSLLGHVRDPSEVLLEARCGSCGLQRYDRYKVVPESATMYIDYITAPAISVSDIS